MLGMPAFDRGYCGAIEICKTGGRAHGPPNSSSADPHRPANAADSDCLSPFEPASADDASLCHHAT